MNAGWLLLALAAAPAPVPADSARVLEEVRRPGASAVLVNVWATWCAPCREEMPDLVRIAKDWKARGLRLILVSADFPEDAAEAARFLGAQGVDFPSFLKEEPDMAFIEALDPRWDGALPATFLYDGAGNLEAFWEGKAEVADLESKIARVVKAAPARGNQEEKKER